MSYLILGLGDTNYSVFCAAAKKISKRLKELGACELNPLITMDDEVNDAIDAVLTFTELKELFDINNIDLDSFEDSLFDPDVTLIIFSIVFILSPGLILSGEYPTKKSLLTQRELYFSRIGIQNSSVQPG